MQITDDGNTSLDRISSEGGSYPDLRSSPHPPKTTTANVHNTQPRSNQVGAVPPFELELHPETSRFTVQTPLFSEEDDTIYPHPGSRYSCAWDFSRSTQNSDHRSTTSLFLSNDPLVNGDSGGYNLMERTRSFFENRYQAFRCWLFQRRQEWQDGHLYSPSSNHSKNKCIRVAFGFWALAVLLLLVGILKTLRQVISGNR